MMEIQGMNELLARFNGGRRELESAIDDGMEQALIVVNEEVPAYPSERPRQKYVRTGALGKSMGSSMGGGKAGEPDIYEINHQSGYVEGRLGSSLPYAEYVIGEGTQASVHTGRWWTNSVLISKAYVKVHEAFKSAMERWIKWMNH